MDFTKQELKEFSGATMLVLIKQRTNNVHDSGRMIEAWRDATAAVPVEAQPVASDESCASVECGACHGSGWVVRDADIGTDQECFSCGGSGTDEEASVILAAGQPAAAPDGAGYAKAMAKSWANGTRPPCCNHGADGECCSSGCWADKQEATAVAALSIPAAVGVADEIDYQIQQPGTEGWSSMSKQRIPEFKAAGWSVRTAHIRYSACLAADPSAPAEAPSVRDTVIREAIEAAFEDRPGWRTKIAAAVRALQGRPAAPVCSHPFFSGDTSVVARGNGVCSICGNNPEAPKGGE